ncbi:MULTISPECIES: lipid-A-disaccharide synthase [Sphingobacterium]|jgi:lipid-A-disaccharide synthase|uniref:Lipid-A-disaccharide synthase n=3 Tax=Sphingobacterium multivorum TaxID=28454 RepID=A0A654DQ81_SPHMU|nr:MULTISPECIES: lipid-A-disaccharide synthase [Sphingobacterium]HAE69782.1 lipid-A-disaccharide synthase [Sphingobacterium sp.]HCX61106.1 lipid-A-disaccharide synthase [Clostridiales bacterium]OFV11598.1 lipid-A-disaccharide synthase [Sphingobacterium sp. HMSC13C05]QQT46591.1 lipid-A-disaccharide synthase [Sphingobacterium multivorum]QQT60802.1 lipid-A-disaccharide synthase [Sphingobacterium multivorum]
MKYYLIAGETSGDLHGANLIKALKIEDPDATFQIVGGNLMQAEAGKKALIHTSEMAFMGFIEVLKNLPKISRNLKLVKNDLLKEKPDTVILIDFPGFNLKIADFAKKNGIKTCYYISPKVWAWNQGRVKKIKRIVGHMFCILPFEVDFYKKWRMPVDYVGNPLLDAISAYQFNPKFREQHGFSEKPLIALLPGSREMEIANLLPIMAELPFFFPGHQFVIAGAPNFDEAYYKQFFKGIDIPVIFNQTYDILHNAEAAVVTSGTATLETGILKVPQVVVYKANPISVWIAKLVIKVKFISLVNLINNFLSVRELIQDECTAYDISYEVGELINNKAHRASVMENYDILAEKLGSPGASEKTAKLIVKYLAKF